MVFGSKVMADLRRQSDDILGRKRAEDSAGRWKARHLQYKSRDTFPSQVPCLAYALFDLARRWQTIHEMVFKMAQLLQLLARDQPRGNSGKA